MARQKKITPEKQLEALASNATKQLALVDKRGESLIYAVAKLGFILIKAQQLHLRATVTRRSDTSGLLLQADGFQTWFSEVFQSESTFSLRTGYRYINATRNVLAITRPDVDPADHHTLDIAAVEEAEKKNLLKGWTLTAAYKSLPEPGLPEDFIDHVMALYGASRAKDKPAAVWKSLLKSLAAWEGKPRGKALAIPGYDAPPPREDETGHPFGWSQQAISDLMPAPQDDDLTAAKTRLRPWLDDTEQLVAELPHDKTLYFLDLDGDPDGLDLHRLLHTAQSLASHIKETIRAKQKS